MLAYLPMCPTPPCTLNSAYNKVAFNEKSPIMKETLVTKYTPFTYKYITLNEKLPIMMQNLHIFFFVIGRVECICIFPSMSHVLGVICMCYGGNIPYVGGVSTSIRLLLSFSTSIGCPLCFILYLSYSSFCLKSTSMAMTTTPPVTVVSSGMSSLSSVTMAPSLMGHPAMLGQYDVVLLTPRCCGGVLGHASVPQQQSPSSMPLQAYANYAMGSPQVGLFFRGEPPIVLYITCLVSVLVSAFYFQVPCWMPYSSLGA